MNDKINTDADNNGIEIGYHEHIPLPSPPHQQQQHHEKEKFHIIPIQEEALEPVEPLKLGWRTWFIVFLSSFTIMAQVYASTAAGSVIAFIVRDIGSSPLSGWIIQGPLLMQAALSPIVGRLSDTLDRKYLVSIPPLIAFIGSVISARATEMNMLIVGGILIGVTLATIAIVQSIPSEILPLKYRMLANGIAFLGGAAGGVIGSLSAGAYSSMGIDGWKYIFWTQAAFHLASSIGFLAFYWPPRHTDLPKLKLKEYVWACDLIGCVLFVSSATLMLLALDWAAGAYPWDDPHVVAPLTIGCVLMVIFGIYEWKFRTDGLVAHAFFKSGPNFPLAVFAFAVEGWIFYSAVNAETPQMILHLGWETDSWLISVRQVSYQIPTILGSLVVTWYSTRYKDIKTPLIVCFILFLVVVICYAVVQLSWNTTQIGLNVISGVGQSGPLTLLVAAVQFTAPHAFLSTATGLAFSARAIGGAFGSAVLDAIIHGHVTSDYSGKVSNAAAEAGMDSESIPKLLGLMAAGDGISTRSGLRAELPGAPVSAIGAAVEAGHQVYARAYQLAWSSIIPFTVIALICVACLRGVKELMTEKVEATLERSTGDDVEKVAT